MFRRRFSLALLGCAGAALPLHRAHAQTAAVSAPVASNGINTIETSGVYPTSANGSNRYLDAGVNNTYPSFAVLDYTTGSFKLNYSVTSVSNLTFTVTEAQATKSRGGQFTVYLSEDTASIATANNGSPLAYQTSGAPSGLGTQLGTQSGNSPTLFSLGSFTADSSTTSTATDTISLTLSGAAQTYFLQQLNGAPTGDLRLVLASTDSSGYLTLNGNTSAVATASQPTLSFSAVLNQPTLAWSPGGAGGGAGTWLPAGTAGDTSWNGGPWVSADTAQFNGTGGSVGIGTGGVSATGIQFNSTGYTLGTNGGASITLTGNSPTVQVTNATDTATINAPVAGTSGLNKTGSGTLVLGGANTYSGTTTITAGTLQVSADTALGNTANGIALAGGTLQSGLSSGNLILARALTGSGGLGIAAGNTLSFTGVVNAGNLTLPGAGTVALTNSSFSLSTASNAVGTVTFSTAGGTLTTSSDSTAPPDGQGVITLGGVTAAQASGAVTLASNTALTGTVAVNVVNGGATLNLPGGLAGAAVIAKTGPGTLSLGGNNSQLSGTGTTPASFRQGTAGASPVTGGTISIAAGNINPNYALGTGQFQANGGTVSNDTGAPVTLAITSISLGAQNSTATPGGLVFAGSGANPSITVTGAISLYRGGTTPYQHTITANTPTTFTGLLTASTNTPTSITSTGLTFAGSSTLTLAGTAPNTFFEAVTIATSGANAGVVAAGDGTFAANTSITLNAGALLTLNTGVQSGTANTINDGALVLFASPSAGAFGKIALSIGTAQETVGGLYLASGDGTLAAGYQPAGTYGATGSGAQYIDNTLFSGTGTILNTASVPEPSTWLTALAGFALLAWRRAGRNRRAGSARALSRVA